MKIYLTSLAVGVLVGVIYHIVNVRSPAPPTWALVGLLGMLLGEQLIPFSKQHFLNTPADGVSTSQSAEQSSPTKTEDTEQ